MNNKKVKAYGFLASQSFNSSQAMKSSLRMPRNFQTGIRLLASLALTLFPVAVNAELVTSTFDAKVTDSSHLDAALMGDSDGDGISDNSDNCTDVANAVQQDSDGDGIGNACDADFDNNCTVNFVDLQIIGQAFLSNDPVTDLNSDGTVNFLDISIFISYFLMPPGPSGLAECGVNTIELVKDINDVFMGLGSFPKRLTKVGNHLYFVTEIAGNNPETILWKSDGTSMGTIPLKTFSAALNLNTQLVAMGDTVFLNIDDGVHGLELWKSSGTPADTVLVEETFPGPQGSVSGLTVFGDSLFFAGFTPDNGTELWKSDGTSAGTVMVKNINPDINFLPSSSNVRDFTVMGDTLYFFATDDSTDPDTGIRTGTDLWKTNGTLATTEIVKDIDSFTVDGKFSNLTAVGNTLFFSAPYDTSSNRNGDELWKSDGTELGTVLVKDINTNSVNSFTNEGAFNFQNSSYFTAVGNTLYFVAYDGNPSSGAGRGWELWKSDGTSNGTQLVKDILTIGFGSSYPENMVSIGNTLYFTAVAAGYGREIWESDGTLEGTVLLKDTLPGSNSGFMNNLGFLTPVGDKLYFSAWGRLWISDGTTDNTVTISDVSIQGFRELTTVGNILYFSAQNNAYGNELWKLTTSN